MIAKIKLWWRGHGTKILGTLTAFFGAAQAAIHAGLIAAGALEQHIVGYGVIALGLLTIKRGFTNSKNLAADSNAI